MEGKRTRGRGGWGWGATKQDGTQHCSCQPMWGREEWGAVLLREGFVSLLSLIPTGVEAVLVFLRRKGRF